MRTNPWIITHVNAANGCPEAPIVNTKARFYTKATFDDVEATVAKNGVCMYQEWPDEPEGLKLTRVLTNRQMTFALGWEELRDGASLFSNVGYKAEADVRCHFSYREGVSIIIDKVILSTD